MNNLPLKTEVHTRDLQSMLICTFRYSLGRTTFIVNECVELLTAYWPLLQDGHKDQIYRDIYKAIESGNAGHDCDIEEWNKISRLPMQGANQ